MHLHVLAVHRLIRPLQAPADRGEGEPGSITERVCSNIRIRVALHLLHHRASTHVDYLGKHEYSIEDHGGPSLHLSRAFWASWFLAIEIHAADPLDWPRRFSVRELRTMHSL